MYHVLLYFSFVHADFICVLKCRIVLLTTSISLEYLVHDVYVFIYVCLCVSTVEPRLTVRSL